MPQTSANARTDLLVRNTSPVIPAGATLAINLSFDRAVNPEDILDALTVKFGAGKVLTDTDTITLNGGWRLRIIP